MADSRVQPVARNRFNVGTQTDVPPANSHLHNESCLYHYVRPAIDTFLFLGATIMSNSSAILFHLLSVFELYVDLRILKASSVFLLFFFLLHF